MKILIKAGARINRWDHSGKTTLAHAVESRCSSAIELLKSLGADLSGIHYDLF